MNDNLLNVVIRIHNTEERSLKSLSFCLFTLFGQNYSPLQPIICCQNFNAEQLEKIKVIVDESLWDKAEAISHQPSAISHQPSAISHQPYYTL